MHNQLIRPLRYVSMAILPEINSDIEHYIVKESPLPSSINGCGTRWYGKSMEADDGSYLVTEWLTFLWIPLIPLGTRRVTPIDDNQFQVIRANIYWLHVFLGYIPLAFIIYMVKR